MSYHNPLILSEKRRGRCRPKVPANHGFEDGLISLLILMAMSMWEYPCGHVGISWFFECDVLGKCCAYCEIWQRNGFRSPGLKS